MKCDHCGLDFVPNALLKSSINGNLRHFCCKGCEGVFTLLHEIKLDDFYSKKGSTTLSPKNSQTPQEMDLSGFDSAEFLEKYAQKISPDSIKAKKLKLAPNTEAYELCLILDKIHCAACIWLNEAIILRQNGVISAQINYTNYKAKIIFDSKKIKPSAIIAAIRAIGYDAAAFNEEESAKNTKKARSSFARIAVGAFCVMNIMWLAVAQYAGYFSGLDPQMRNILNFAEFALATPVLFFVGAPFWRGAKAAIIARAPNMDFLLLFGTLIAYFYSIYAALNGFETYFESVAMIIVFVSFGKFLESRGRKNATDALDRAKTMMINEAILLEFEKKPNLDSMKNLNQFDIESQILQKQPTQRKVSPSSVKVGSFLKATANSAIALDGVLLSKSASFDESARSGESLPVIKKCGDPIFSGSVVLGADIIYQSTKSLKDSFIYELIGLVEDALCAKSHTQIIAERISRYFSAVVLSIALISFAVHLALGADFSYALLVGVCVCIISCPCALALATPIASVVGLGASFSRGVLFKEARFLELLSSASYLVLDKTGTLTKGKLQITKSFNLKALSEIEAYALVCLLNYSKHPISRAVANFVLDFDFNFGKIDSKKLNNFLNNFKREEIPGGGICGNFIKSFNEFCSTDSIFKGGNAEFVGLNHTNLAPNSNLKNFIKECENAANSVFYFCLNNKFLCAFALEDEIKQNAKEVIKELQKMKITPILLSGDNEKVCEKIAKKLDIKYFLSSKNPKQKADFIASLCEKNSAEIQNLLKNSTHNLDSIKSKFIESNLIESSAKIPKNTQKPKAKNLVCFCGDGANDAGALARADISIAMGSGLDLALASSDIILLNSTPNELLNAFKIAKKCRKIIVQNLSFSLLYNAALIPLACIGAVIPLIAAAAMSTSSLIVVLNSLRLANYQAH